MLLYTKYEAYTGPYTVNAANRTSTGADPTFYPHGQMLGHLNNILG